MIDLFYFGLGCAVTWTSMFYGSYRGRSATPKPPKPFCHCTHSYGEHDEKGCHATLSVLVERGKPKSMGIGYDGTTRKVVYDYEKYEQKPCACKTYTGPEPLPQVYA